MKSLQEMNIGELEALINEKSKLADSAWKLAKEELRTLNALRDKLKVKADAKTLLDGMNSKQKEELRQLLGVSNVVSETKVAIAKT